METLSDIKTLQVKGLLKLCDDVFTDEIEYVRQVSSHNKVGSLHRPIVAINAVDDPIAPMSDEDIANIDNDPNLCFWFFGTGGHCGYVKSMFPKVTNCIDDVVVESSDLLTQFCNKEKTK